MRPDPSWNSKIDRVTESFRQVCRTDETVGSDEGFDTDITDRRLRVTLRNEARQGL